MTRKTVTLVRNSKGFLASNTIGTDALSAISTIQGIEDVQIEKESEDEVEISYLPTDNELFLETETHLSKFYLRLKE